uniref:Calponin-homology (CH) domain-containing protein n=1 Tax=Varanus komodoensis TaxID=61221 RepID=A0A8D2JDB5_VARKO
MQAYTARCKLNKLRRSACRLFTSDEMVKAIKRLEVEIEAKRLLVRKDRHLWKDIGERQKILNWLLCYNPLWLRIGLEAVYGELIALESNSDVMGLAMFILNRLLWNPDIAAEYRHATVPHLYRDGHEEALSKFTLKKLLLLVCFLDRAKLSRIIDHDPCLFCKDAKFKSSKELLLAFSRDFLSGEGDLSRHLGFLGFPVNHVQTPLDEFDFAVTNLAVDLQCGIRLVRALELLSSDWSLSKNLRVPAISRLQKMHNVKIALQVLKDHGIQLKDDHGAAIEAKDIVDRHREKTFALLWKTVFAFQVNVSLDMDQLKEEIGFLNNMYEKKAKATALASSAASKVRKDSNSFYSSENYSEKVKLLMDWVNAVCRSYNVKAENFTVSFSDGRVLCFLIHHYHPCYIPLEAVCQRTTQTVECTKSGSIALNSSSESDSSLNILNGSFDQTITTSVLYKELLDNEKKNFQLINAAVSDLGGVPAMIHHSDMSNTIPDEKVVITYVSFLCSRLLDLSKEIRAARLIQSTWRNYRFKVKLAQSAVLFFFFYQTKKQELNATVVIQKYWRRYLAQMELKKLKRAKDEEDRMSSLSATTIQSFYRMYRQRKSFLKLVGAAKLIQQWYRGCKNRNIQLHKYRLHLRKMHAAATIIQRSFKTFLQRRHFLTLRAAAVTVQWKYRAAILSKQQHARYQTMKLAAILIQRRYRALCRGRNERKHYLELRNSSLILQAAYRGMRVRQELKTLRQSATTIQSFYRMYRRRKSFLKLVGAAKLIQQWYCGCKNRNIQLHKYRQMKSSALRIQSAFRGMRARKSLKQMHRASTVIQSSFRMHIAYTQFRALWRGYSWRKKTDTAKTKALRDSLLIATKESKEEKKLCNRTSLAIDHLLKYKHYSYILAALKDLEVVTRLSPVCCENMAQSEAVFTIFTLIRSCNRSVPCMDVIRYSVQVLLNLSKYDRTTQAVYEVGNSIETLLDLLQMYRERAGDKTSEKGGSIFTKTCCLFALLAQDLNRAYEIRSDPRVVTRLQSLFKLTARKHQMDAQRMIAKQKSGAYKNGHSCVSTPRRTRLVSTPEWVLRKDNMQEIVDPLQAIQMVLDTLGISCN